MRGCSSAVGISMFYICMPGARSELVVGGGPFELGARVIEGLCTAYGESAEEDLRTKARKLDRGRWIGASGFRRIYT
jgi:hypothetical protein